MAKVNKGSRKTNEEVDYTGVWLLIDEDDELIMLVPEKLDEGVKAFYSSSLNVNPFQCPIPSYINSIPEAAKYLVENENCQAVFPGTTLSITF